MVKLSHLMQNTLDLLGKMHVFGEVWLLQRKPLSLRQRCLQCKTEASNNYTIKLIMEINNWWPSSWGASPLKTLQQFWFHLSHHRSSRKWPSLLCREQSSSKTRTLKHTSAIDSWPSLGEVNEADLASQLIWPEIFFEGNDHRLCFSSTIQYAVARL